jgi:hypothetical protein
MLVEGFAFGTANVRGDGVELAAAYSGCLSCQWPLSFLVLIIFSVGCYVFFKTTFCALRPQVFSWRRPRMRSE